MNQYFKPANAYMFWDWLSSIDFTESVFIKLYLMKIIKFYVKRYPDIVKQTINDHRDELQFFIDNNETNEKILIAWIKHKTC